MNRPLLASVLAFLTDRDKAWWYDHIPNDVTQLVLSDRRVFNFAEDNDWIASIGHVSPVEAWEALAQSGIIPTGAADDPARRFAVMEECHSCDGERACYVCGTGRDVEVLRSHPDTFEDIVSFASVGWQAILHVEGLARELALAYGCRCDCIVWSIGRVPGVTECPSLPPAMAVRAMGFAVAELDRDNNRVTIACPSVGPQ